MILADTSIRIDHLRQVNSRFNQLLLDGEIAMHPMVLGELACGSLKNRAAAMWRWRRMRAIGAASNDEAIEFLENHPLMSMGLSFIDVHLLTAFARQPESRLWTRDRRLRDEAHRLDRVFRELDA